MPDTTDQSQVSASSSGKKKPMINLPEWLGKPGVEFLVRVSATALVFWLILSFVIGVHICHADSEGYDTGLPNGSSFECTVPQDCVFVLNDNPNDLSDSRLLGGIPLTECERTVILLIRRRGF